MSILIRGMTMPKKCLWCPLQYIGFCQVTKTDVNSDLGRRADDCPLVELPEKHGRLVDADAFAEFIEGTIKRQHYEDIAIDETLTIADVLTAIIDDLKGNTIVKYESNLTVIEVEGEE